MTSFVPSFLFYRDSLEDIPLHHGMKGFRVSFFDGDTEVINGWVQELGAPGSGVWRWIASPDGEFHTVERTGPAGRWQAMLELDWFRRDCHPTLRKGYDCGGVERR